MKKSTEAQHQTAVMQWADLKSSKYPELELLFHVPNGGKRDKIEAKHLKEQGVKPGVPDLCLPVPRGYYHGLYIEMKTESGKTSSEQDWWIKELNRHGYYATVCFGWQSAVKIIEQYLKLEGAK